MMGIVSHSTSSGTSIYILVDPRPDRIECYVGQTSQTLNKRFNGHLTSNNGTLQKSAWLDDLTINNLKPELYLLEVIDTANDKNVDATELEWIAAFHRSKNHISVNSYENIYDSRNTHTTPLIPRYLTKPFVKYLVSEHTKTSNRPSGKIKIPYEVFISWRSSEPFDIDEYRRMVFEYYDNRLALIEKIFQEDTPEKKAAIKKLFKGDILHYLIYEESNGEGNACAEKLINMGCWISTDAIDLLQANIDDEWCNEMLQKIGVVC